MVKIQPVTYPIHGDAIYLHCLVLNFPTNAIDCDVYYEILTSDSKKCVIGNIKLTPEEFTAWGQDNKYIDDLVAAKLNLKIEEYIVNQNNTEENLENAQ